MKMSCRLLPLRWRFKGSVEAVVNRIHFFDSTSGEMNISRSGFFDNAAGSPKRINCTFSKCSTLQIADCEFDMGIFCVRYFCNKAVVRVRLMALGSVKEMSKDQQTHKNCSCCFLRADKIILVNNTEMIERRKVHDMINGGPQ